MATAPASAAAAAEAPAAVTAAAAAAASFGELVRRGMRRFEANDVEGSLADFDAAAALAPERRALLWQRGLSLFYASRFAEGASQFRLDVAANPNDTEEAIWALLCEARLPDAEAEAAGGAASVGGDGTLSGAAAGAAGGASGGSGGAGAGAGAAGPSAGGAGAATSGFLRAQRAMLSVGRDSRAVMRAAYAVFRGEAPLGALRAAAAAAAPQARAHDAFYALLYEGLFLEAGGAADAAADAAVAAAGGGAAGARGAILRAVASEYGAHSGDYMASLARVHALRSGWMVKAPPRPG